MESIELRIDSLAAGGDGVARAPDGRVVFVPLTAPGDQVRVRLTESRSRYARAELLEVVESGPGRIAPPCPHFGVCGGCAWQHLEYGAQVEAKRRILLDALERIGRIALEREPVVHGSPSPFGYRTRARLLVRDGRAGYRMRGSSRHHPVDACPVLAPDLEKQIGSPPIDEGDWEIGSASLEVGGDRLAISTGVFAQANRLLLDDLAGAVHEAAGRGERALELFAGAGFLTLGLARRFTHLVALEGNADAVRDLRSNLAAATLANVNVVHAPVEDALQRDPVVELAPETVVLDPPRTGFPRGLAAELAGLEARRIVYVSCDPATLARDARALVDHGYAVDRVELFDLFPQTPHVETLMLLRG